MEVICYCCGEFGAEEQMDVVGIGADAPVLYWCGCEEDE